MLNHITVLMSTMCVGVRLGMRVCSVCLCVTVWTAHSECRWVNIKQWLLMASCALALCISVCAHRMPRIHCRWRRCPPAPSWNTRRWRAPRAASWCSSSRCSAARPERSPPDCGSPEWGTQARQEGYFIAKGTRRPLAWPLDPSSCYPIAQRYYYIRDSLSHRATASV